MPALITTPNLPSPDDFHEALLAAHDGLTEAQTHALNARLILVLANHIGDTAVLLEALAAASRTSDTTQARKAQENTQ